MKKTYKIAYRQVSSWLIKIIAGAIKEATNSQQAS